MKKLFITAAIALGMTSPAWADAQAAGAVLAMVAYVAEHCPDYRDNPVGIERAMSNAGFDTATWTDHLPSKVLISAATIGLSLDKVAGPSLCKMLFQRYGNEGGNEPALFRRR